MAKVSSKCLPSDAAAPLGAEAMTCMHPVSPPTATPPPQQASMDTDGTESWAVWSDTSPWHRGPG